MFTLLEATLLLLLFGSVSHLIFYRKRYSQEVLDRLEEFYTEAERAPATELRAISLRLREYALGHVRSAEHLRRQMEIVEYINTRLVLPNLSDTQSTAAPETNAPRPPLAQ